MKAYEYLSETVKEIDSDGRLKELWESVYKERLDKHGNKKKARISANAKVYSECLKIFKKENINERFLDYVKTSYSDNSYPVHKNPSSKEMKEIRKTQGKDDNELRGIIDFDKKDFYLFPSNLLHQMVSNKFNRKFDNATNIMCEFIPSKGKLKVLKITHVKGDKKKLEKEQWLKKYLDI